jgi:hypothetical protein
MKGPKKVATLYVYGYTSKTNWAHNHGLKAFVAPNNDFMTSIFETFEEDGWGDHKYFEVDYVGYEEGDNVGFTKWKLKKILKLTQEGLEGLGIKLEDFKKNVKTPLEDLSFGDFEIEYFGEAEYNKLFFDSSSIAEPFKDLSNDQLDSLIKSLESFKK